MRKKSLLALAFFSLFGTSGLSNANTDTENHFNFKIEGGYIKFNNSGDKELKARGEIKVEGRIEHNELYIKAGDVYKSFRRNTVSNLNSTTNSTEPIPDDLKKGSMDTNILYVKGGARLQNVEFFAGGMLSAGSGALPRLRAIDTGVKTQKFIVLSPVAYADLGFFAQYSKLKREEYRADVVQFTPSVYITYSRVRTRIYLNLQAINSNLKYHNKNIASGGIDITADLNEKLSLIAGAKLGKSLYLSKDGENFDIFPRFSINDFHLGMLLHLTPTVDASIKGVYETYRVLDIKQTEQTGKVETTLQRGLGLQAGLNMKF